MTSLSKPATLTDEQWQKFSKKFMLDRLDVQEILGISHPTALKLMRDPSFPSVLVGKRRKVALPAFLEWLKCQGKL